MSEIERLDVLVFGSGVGGKLTAWTSASEGLRTAVVERRLIGGSCPNIACLPTKNVIHSAKVADFVRHYRDFGTGTAPASIEMAEVMARKRRMVPVLQSGTARIAAGTSRNQAARRHACRRFAADAG